MKSPKYSIGEYTYGKIHILGEHLLDELTIGKFCSIGPSVTILVKGYHHNPSSITTYPFGSPQVPGWPSIDVPKKHQKVVIGNDVWIGHSAMIYNDVTIGDGAIIAARAVVTKDVAPYAIVGGVPAEELRKRFSDEEITRLLELKWWDWDKAKIAKNIPILYGSNIDQLGN